MNRKEEQRQVRRRERLAGTRQRRADAVQEAGRQQREAEKRRALERAQQVVDEGKEKPRPDRNAEFADRGERGVNNTVPAPPVSGRKRKPLPPMQEAADPGAPS